MQNNTLFPYTYEFGILSGAFKNTRQFKELALWPDGSEPVTVTSREYWGLSDVLKTVRGAVDGKFFSTVFKLDEIIRANTPSKIKSETKPTDHINVKVKNGSLVELELSRYACWTLMKELGKNTSTVFQQEYFLNPNKKLAEICKTMQETSGRIYLRGKATQLERQLHGILDRFIFKSTPTQYRSKYHSQLNSYIAKCLYGNSYETVRDIKESNHIPVRAALSDYMNYDLLNAYCNALENIIAKWDTMATPRTHENLRSIIYNEMTATRSLFGRGRPEQNFAQTPISKIQKLQEQRELEFAKKYINVKVR